MPEQNKYKIYVYSALILIILAAGYWYWKSRQKSAPKELTPQQIINNLSAPATTSPVSSKTLKSLSAPAKQTAPKIQPSGTTSKIPSPAPPEPAPVGQDILKSLSAPGQ